MRRLVGFLLALVLSLAVIVAPEAYARFTDARINRTLQTVARSSFRLETALIVAAYPTENWKENFPKFSQETGAVLMGEYYYPTVGHFIVIKFPTGGGTAFFFSKAMNWDGLSGTVYVMTNAHVAEATKSLDDLKKKETWKTVVSGLLDDETVYCPNFTIFESAPSCEGGEDAYRVYLDRELDIAVLEFRNLRKEVLDSIPVLELADELPPAGTVLYTIGAGLGINDLRGQGRLLPSPLPFSDNPAWKWNVYYDMDSAGGFSGSPVVDARGRVVGVHKGASLDPRGSGRSVALMIPMYLVKPNLALNGVPVGAVKW